MIDLGIVAIIGIIMTAILWKKVKDYKAGNSGCGCGGCNGCGGGCQSCTSNKFCNK